MIEWLIASFIGILFLAFWIGAKVITDRRTRNANLEFNRLTKLQKGNGDWEPLIAHLQVSADPSCWVAANLIINLFEQKAVLEQVAEAADRACQSFDMRSTLFATLELIKALEAAYPSMENRAILNQTNLEALREMEEVRDAD